MEVFLQKNGWEISSTEQEAFTMMMDLASGSLTKAKLSAWLKQHSSKVTRG
jgi:death-on-curing protein